MPYLRLTDLGTGRVVETRDTVVTLGRDPGSTVVVAGPTAGVVSARHAEIRHTAGEWRVLDLGSRNGTFVNGQRAAAGTALAAGDVVRLGESGPAIRIEVTAERLAPTIPEQPALPPAPAAVVVSVNEEGVSEPDVKSNAPFPSSVIFSTMMVPRDRLL